MMLAIGCFCLPSGLRAQEVIHAVSGTVESINAAGKTITLQLDDGSSRLFKQMPRSTQSMSFDKTLQAQSTAATELHQLGQHVIMFYYGYDDLTTAVAFIDIGQGASKPISGSIAQYDGHQHVLTVKGPAAQLQKIAVTAKTVVDTADGAVDGLNYHPTKGRRILVVASSGGTEQAALFISPFE